MWKAHLAVHFVYTLTVLIVLLKILSGQQAEKNGCEDVCQDLPGDDTEPICMMLSRYKRGYEFFVNLCHARQTICREKLENSRDCPGTCFKAWGWWIRTEKYYDNNLNQQLRSLFMCFVDTRVSLGRLPQ